MHDYVEKFWACTLKYTFLNIYTIGFSYLSQHKDSEFRLDEAFPIIVFSFGSERTIDFKDRMQHGTLCNMLKPSNNLFTHGIAPEPNVKNTSISLTFISY